ncbi:MULTISPECIES: KpsF/GutQ family sugar-phosphate isomerase [unclassified Hyphomonas]|uniref:KpsF/GutQ family sugar-phosphate isomerase n=1 Tax=unclassified Hyphomonas TaxID=2630699 RepID=UPI0025BBF2C6|nr:MULTISPECIES: KpsF/GutQ family sugar-phosphate isomerase [unclassified Hyphomonas]
MTRESDIDIARNVIRIEREALEQLEAGLDTAIEKAADLIMATDRHIIVAGVGKSGHIGQKIAASLASTGTPSFFLHPTEASHGDLGMIVPGSVVIAISYSGESRELVDLIRYCRTNSVPLIGMSRAAESTLGRGSDVLLTLPTVAEACPNGLAPTSSTTMALALGDALTIVLMARRGFSREEFGFRHPGGKLGRSLQTAGDYVASRTDDIPSVGETAAVEDVILAISEGRKGCVAVLDATGVIAGMVTDGDLRRAMLAGKLTGNAAAIMTPSPRTISLDERMSAVIKRLTEHRISNAFVVQDGRPVGIVDMKDLLAEGYV